MSTNNAAAFAYILQMRRDLPASQPQDSSGNAQRSPQFRGHSPRPVPANSSSSYQPQYTAAPYQQQYYNAQQPQLMGAYPDSNVSQNLHALGFPQQPQQIHQQSVNQFGWQQPQQNWQHKEQQSISAFPGTFQNFPSTYPSTSSSITQFGGPGVPYQPVPVTSSYQNQQYPYPNQYQTQPSYPFMNNIASPLSVMPGMNGRSLQSSNSSSSSSKSLTGVGTSQSYSNSISNSFKADNGQEHIAEETPQLYYCEGCEKEFTQKIAYDAHCANHETCRHPGCTFSGTKKVVIAHFHGSHGLYSGEGYKMIEVEGSKKKFRVLLGVSPEEIEKWRMDRRKNFPTAENTQKKKEQRDELRKAGGLILDAGKKRKRESVVHSKKELVKTEGTDGGEVTDCTAGVDNGLVEGAGEGAVEGEGDNEDKDKDNKLRKRPCVFFVKGSCKQGDQCTYSHDFEIKVCNFFVRSGRCTRGNRCTFSHDKEERAKFLEERKAGGGKKLKEKGGGNSVDLAEGGVGGDREGEEGVRERKPQKARNERDKGNAKEELNDEDLRARVMKKKGQLFLPKPFSGGSRGTLLRNLLLHEVEEEENILLQCLRLIVSNNYLQPAL